MSTSDDIKSGINTMNKWSQTARQGQRAVNQFGSVFGLAGNEKTAAQAAKQGVPAMQQAVITGGQAAPQGVLNSPIQNVSGKKYYTGLAPIGTRLIIPKELSSTGQERYLGAHALESIMNLMQGNEKCGNIIVLDAQGTPSTQLYQRSEDGNILLKGTQKEIKVDSTSIMLSEEEFAAIKEALNKKTNDVTYFKTSKELGNAEDSTAQKGSWFSQNWWKILLGLVVAGGIAWGGIAIYNNHKEKKEKKQVAAAQSQTTTASDNSATNNQSPVQTAALASATNTGSALSGTNITNESSLQANININSGNSI